MASESGQTRGGRAGRFARMELEPRRCYEVLLARDRRFDGTFFVGVSTTGVYCRPVCTARTPRADRCSFFPTASLAEAAGFRPCLRCRPELAPGRAPIDAPRSVARRAVGRIQAGALAERGIEGLAREFGLSGRQLRRVVEREYGVPPVALEQTRRLLLAKQLLTDTPMKIVDVAFASGFGSVRRFNHLFRTRYRVNPTALRRRRHADATAIELGLGYRPPLAWRALVGFLSARGSPRTERLEDGRYLRVVRLAGKTGWVRARCDAERNLVVVEVSPGLVPVLSPLLVRLRHLFDLDADPIAIAARLGRDPALRGRIARTPGLRIPGALDGFDLALRTVLGQQITVKAATTLYCRLTERFGTKVSTPYPGLDRAPPSAGSVAGASVADLTALGVTSRRAETIRELAEQAATHRLRLAPGAELDSTRAALRAIPGIGPWTAEYVALRALGDPDAWPDADLGLARALALPKPADLARRGEAFRPWRGYAALHLWNESAQGG